MKISEIINPPLNKITTVELAEHVKKEINDKYLVNIYSYISVLKQLKVSNKLRSTDLNKLSQSIKYFNSLADHYIDVLLNSDNTEVKLYANDFDAMKKILLLKLNELK